MIESVSDPSDLSDLSDRPARNGESAWRCGELTAWGAEKLTSAGIDQAGLEAQLLLAHALGGSRLEILSWPERQIDPNARRRYVELIQRRRIRTPLAYLRGTHEFYGLEFMVTPDVLIPRPETELLVDVAVEIAGAESTVIWDVGTGSGCIAVACARKIPNAQIIASDISRSALDIAAQNVRRHAVNSRCMLAHSDMLSAARPGEVTIILSNPPYISHTEIAALQPEVRDFEPRLALEASNSGMSAYNRLVPQAWRVLRRGGWLAVEVAIGKAAEVSALFDQSGFKGIAIRYDLAGIQRVVLGRKN